MRAEIMNSEIHLNKLDIRKNTNKPMYTFLPSV